MFMFILRRLGQIVLSLVVILIITFYLMHSAPGDFFNIERLANQQITGARLSQFEEKSPTLMLWEERYGEHTPIWKQVAIYVRHAAVLDFGPSFRYPDTTLQELMATHFPRTFILAFLPMFLALLIGIPMGVLAAVYRNTWIDRVTMFVSMLGICIPSYVIALLVIVLFAVTLQWLPTSGWGSWHHVVLPVLAMMFQPVASIARYVRASLAKELNEDYVRTVFAKGGDRNRAIFRHALRNSLIPLLTISGPQFAFLMVSTAFIETVFNIPGLGKLFVAAAGTRDYPMIITSTLFFGFLIMVMNLLVDLAYALIDPRIRASYQRRR
jgi:peptide/nickel transport system permease protein